MDNNNALFLDILIKYNDDTIMGCNNALFLDMFIKDENAAAHCGSVPPEARHRRD